MLVDDDDADQRNEPVREIDNEKNEKNEKNER